MKAKIVVDARMLRMSGIGTYLQQILPGLLACAEYEWVILLNRTQTIPPFLVPYEKIFFDSPVLGLQEQFEYRKKIPPCDLLWIPNWNAPVFPSLAKNLLITIHDINHVVNKDQFGLIKHLVATWMVGASLRKSAGVITVSDFSRQEIVRYYHLKKLNIEVSHLAVSDTFSDYIPEEIGVRNYILAVGNIKPHKNIKSAIEAFKQLDVPDLKFVLVGKREGFKTGYGAELNQLTEELGNKLLFTGEVDENTLKNYYAKARGFVFPSLYEGFGLPLLEAMKFNLPILASNMASIPEIISPLATQFNPKVKDDLTVKMESWLKANPDGTRIDYSSHLKQFSWQKTIENHLKTIQQILTK